ncbi:MAG: SDR family oxidoreductase [Leptospiraceae bacterium]|nr:SDR family oxidoreductase [Leptospiraceae bacterium]MCP5495525.1 SDR family oxidoreductase [Leptospiraceae bacterium]
MSKTVVITGGSGAVGRALVKLYVAEGFQTAFTYNQNEDSANQLIKETNALAIKANLTNQNDVDNVIRKVIEKFQQIDILINNAGKVQIMPLALIEEEDWDDIIAANLKSMFLMTKGVVRNMIQRKQGIIINIGSIAGHRMLEVPVHYATAKAGVSGFTLSLATELSRYNIRVNEVIPGLLTQGVGKNVPEKELSHYTEHTSLGRPGEPEEVADLVFYLTSEKSKYINAQSIHINGGI